MRPCMVITYVAACRVHIEDDCILHSALSDVHWNDQGLGNLVTSIDLQGTPGLGRRILHMLADSMN